jgi:hypothetical protein
MRKDGWIMKFFFSRRILFGLVFLVAVCASAAVYFSGATRAYADAKTLEGTWNVTTTFTSGPLTGQTKQGTITYAGDGTLTALTDGLQGSGTWSMTSKLGFHYEFTEQIFQGGRHVGDVKVVEDGNLSKNAKTDSAGGTGTFYANTPNGPIPTGANQETATQTRIKHAD